MRAPPAERLHLAFRRKLLERPLNCAWAGTKRDRQGRTWPRLSVSKQGEHRRMLLFDGWRQHDDLSRAAWFERKASFRRTHVCQRPKLHTKPPDFYPQASAMRFIGVLAAEGAC